MADIEPMAFRAARVERMLAEDPQIAEAGLRVHVRGDRVVLSGAVSSTGRRDRARAVVQDSFPELDAVDEVTVAGIEPPAEAERLP